MQLDQQHRGFSLKKEGPLDMRMDPTSSLTAEEIVNTWPEKDLARCIREYGEEPFWRRISRAIVQARRNGKISTTKELADVVLKEIPSRGKKKIHPATLVFQALRICVNRELESLEDALKQAITMLSKGSKGGVISFHSLEDRIVKHIFKAAAEPLRDMKGNKISRPHLRVLTKKVVVPKVQEIRNNRRARSAKMRFVEKI